MPQNTNLYPIPIKLDYTNLDYETIVAEVKSRIKYILPEWTDFLDSNVGITLVQLFSYISSSLTFYVDRQAAETYIHSALSPRNIFRLVDLINYLPHGPMAAEGEVLFSLAAPHTKDIVIPKGTVVSTSGANSVKFTVPSDQLLPKFSTVVNVRVLQGEPTTEIFIGTGEAFQKWRLGSKQAATNTLDVVVAGVRWTRVNTFVGADKTAEFYIVKTDSDGNIYVCFGDDVEAAAPTLQAEIRVWYTRTIGSLKQIQPDVVTMVSSQIKDVDGTTMTLLVTNPQAISGGSAAETPDEIKLHAPAIFRSGNRAVTKEDFEVHAEAYPGVANVRVLDVNDEESIPMSQVRMYVAADNGALASSGLVTGLQRRMEDLCPASIIPSVRAAQLVPVDIAANINVYATFEAVAVRAQVIQALLDLLSPAIDPAGRAAMGLQTPGLKVGDTVYVSAIGAAALAVPGVASVTLTEPKGDVVVGSRAIGTSRVVTVSIGQIL